MVKVKPELSKKNKYWIDKNRYYELKYFCLQYPTWKHAYDLLDGLHICSYDLSTLSRTNNPSDPISHCVDERSIYYDRMKLVQEAALKTDPYLASYILKAVTEGYSYSYLESILEIPCSRDMYYDRYRRFFWILDKMKD